MKTNVRYDADVREKAAAARHGLYTIDIVEPGKDGRFCGQITTQGTMDQELQGLILELVRKLLEVRNGK